MAPSSNKIWPSVLPWSGRRTQTDLETPNQTRIAESSYSLQPQRSLRRSASALSPTSPTLYRNNTSSDTLSPSTGSVRSGHPYLGLLIRRRKDDDAAIEISSESGQSPEQSAHLPNNQPTSATRSGPSIITTSPAQPLSNAKSGRRRPSASSNQPSQDPISSISAPSLDNPYAWPESDPSLPSPIAAVHSPISYSRSEPSSTIQSYPIVGPVFSSTPPATSAMRPFAGATAAHTASRNQYVHQQGNQAQEGFTSPSDFALFVEATSSLSIMPDDNQSSSGSDTSARFPPQITTTRLRAPLPALPRSHAPPLINPSLALPSGAQSLTLPSPAQPPALQRSVSQPPAPINNNSGRQRPSRFSVQGPISHSQILADALLGLENDPEQPNDDELPDYETSQMEANARQRWEAAKRARALDEAWRRARQGLT